MSNTNLSLQEFLDVTALKTPKDYVQNLLKTVHSKNITIEDWNIFIYQLQELISHDADAYRGFVSVLAELSAVYGHIQETENSLAESISDTRDYIDDLSNASTERIKTLEDTVGLSPDGQYIHVPIEYGEGVDSIVQKAAFKDLANRALAQSSVALGAGTIAGMSGFWFTEINFNTQQIRLSSNTDLATKIYPTVSTETLAVNDSSFECPYEIGDIFCIRIPQMHYPFVGEISEIQGDIIFYNPYQKAFTFEIIPIDEEDFRTRLDLYSIAVPHKPDVGVVPVSTANYSEGYKTIAAAMYSHTEGADTVAGGGYGHAEGFDTWAGYAAHSQNARTRALSNYSTAGGFNTSVVGQDVGTAFGIDLLVNARAGFGSGGSNELYGDYGHTEGFSNTVTVKGLHGHVEGNECVVDAVSGHAQNGKTRVYADYGDASGFNTEVSAGAIAARAAGQDNVVKAKYASQDGYQCTIEPTATAGHSSGIGNILYSKAGYIGGEGCRSSSAQGSSSWYQFLHGHYLYGGDRIAQAIFGRFNAINNDAVFQIGNGVNENARSNAFEVISTRSGSTNYVSLKVGNTTITENQLKQLLALLG